MSCPKCVEGYELPGEPVGSIQADFLGAYFTPGSVSGDKRAVVLLTDAFGLPLKNCKIIADRIAKDVGCDVWVPDYFAGQSVGNTGQVFFVQCELCDTAGRPIIPLDAMNMPDKAEQRATVLDWIKFVFNGIPAIPGFIRNRASVVDARLESVRPTGT
jgi:dienelactone hydrolase